MRSERSGWGVLAALLAACGPAEGPAVETVVLTLEGIPERVRTLSVVVLEVETGEVVASATAAAPRTSFELGVPAEVPLELQVVARTDRPGPRAIGAMPAYFGSTLRTIALDRERERVSLVLHPAGVLTLGTRVEPGVVEDEDQTLGVRLEREGSAARPRDLVLAPLDPERWAPVRSLVLRTGWWSARAFHHEDGPDVDPVVRSGRGLYVGREQESVAAIELVPEGPEPLPGDPVRLELALLDEAGRSFEGRVATEASSNRPIAVRIVARDAAGREVRARVPRLEVSVAAEPPELLRASPAGPPAAASLPLVVPGLAVRGTGTLVVRARATTERGALAEGDAAANLLGPGVVPGPPAAITLGIEEPARLTSGTWLTLDVLDAAGLYASAAGLVDLSRSDPWAYLPDGSGTALAGADRGHLRRRILRPSGPRGLPVVVRATFTSTAAAGTLTSSVVLPLLEITP